MVKNKPQYRHALISLGDADYPQYGVLSGKTLQSILQGFWEDGYKVHQPEHCLSVNRSGETPAYQVLMFFAELRD